MGLWHLPFVTHPFLATDFVVGGLSIHLKRTALCVGFPPDRDTFIRWSLVLQTTTSVPRTPQRTFLFLDLLCEPKHVTFFRVLLDYYIFCHYPLVLICMNFPQGIENNNKKEYEVQN